jgi:hypothetical protein
VLADRIDGLNENARTTDDLARLVDNAELIAALADVFVGARSPSVSVYVADNAPNPAEAVRLCDRFRSHAYPQAAREVRVRIVSEVEQNRL